jgi:hypothetical protein|nr:MAG TPA: late-transcription coactivator [Caudoviricetes sp.]
MNEIQKINKFYEYLRNNKTNESIIDLLEDFCFEYNISYEEIGMLISEDEYLKDFVKKDCINRGLIKSDKKSKIEF